MADVSFGVLGHLSVRVGDRPVKIQGNKRRVLLATLLLRANRTVPVDELIDRMWGVGPSEAHRGALQVHVTRLRAALALVRAGQLIMSGTHGYRIELADHQLDLLRTRALAVAALDAEHHGDLPRRCDALGQALALWRGPVLADVVSPSLHEHEVRHVTEELLRTAELRYETMLALGRHGPALPGLAELVGRHPHRETLVRLLMVALYRSGRQSEALEVYERTRQALAERLGIDPGRDLQAAFHSVLRGDLEDQPLVPRQRSVLAGPQAAALSDSAGRVRLLPPAQLPADIPFFVGRRGQLAALDRLRADVREPRRALISGPTGAGGTALAVRWAHRAAAEFPDGQLYVDLRGDTGAPRDPADVMRRFLRPFGVLEGLPVETDERAALLRSVLARRRLLMVLDNAYSAEQVRPLLPGTPSCAVVVTSRYWLADLIVREGVLAVAVGELAPGEARVLLRRLVGPERVAAEPAAVDRLLDLTGRLPLPLRLAAAWLVTHPGVGISALVTDIAARRARDPAARVAAALGGDPRFLIGEGGAGEGASLGS
ncbi:AfsR/SARP family transcriptional regulator [Marinitenerispora sediminis]|uniref:AfsR/SARP family transcriptional regulator n=1 Tax=Marinitenerispora sediminis TaxID=1931232 RepID=A0A368TBL9_9ACTN|nr:AfsR/SARP family transcriptional regulator [Marinitenerispora sediminis]RCV51692.1 AfsR/SARP family transcriptional regulator [Marinitenerispora sediminis]RCV58141.1 AfsR/SARP family transcriptional regulator [Marinitenerispora sediminis]RCV62512.1 AfsR/SARP family transcriptional regulator [Marinitenerispora sediminis]